MARKKETEQPPRPEAEKLDRSDPRLTSIPIPCQVCKHLGTMGSQFSADGWTCPAYPDGIPYSVLTRGEDHIKHRFTQVGDKIFDPVVFNELDTDREWVYNFDGSWRYLDEADA